MGIKRTLSRFLIFVLLLLSVNLPVATAETSEQLIFHHPDHLSGASVDTDISGNVIESVDYYPYGEIRIDAKTTTYENKHKFTGKELDESDNLYYYGARYYDPSIGRFISADPVDGDLSNPQSQNRYSYVLNNPLKHVDVTGNMAELVIASGLTLGAILSAPVSALVIGGAAIVAGIAGAAAIYEESKALSATAQVNTNTQAKEKTNDENDYITLYRGDDPGKTFFFANGLKNGVGSVFESFAGDTISQDEIDTHQSSSKYSPYISATMNPSIAETFANGPNGDKWGSVYTMKIPKSQVVYMGGTNKEYGIRFMVLPHQIVKKTLVPPKNTKTKFPKKSK